ncbi:synaptojanin-1 [Sarcoptes scabiei]|nr:synaptojanin-1 [Sarcoptes scabiei]
MHNNDDVLDDLLNNGDEEDFDAELKIAVKNDRLRKESKKSKTFEIETKSNNNSSNDGNNSNGNHRKRRSISRESSCDSQYSCDSGSCSCEHHSSMNEDDGDDDDNVGDDGKEEIDRHRDGKIKDRDRKIDVKNGVRSTIHSKHNAIDYEDDEEEKDGDDADENGHHRKDKTYRRASPARSNHSSYRSYTRSPNLKIKISKNSNSRTIADKQSSGAHDNDAVSDGYGDGDRLSKTNRHRKRNYRTLNSDDYDIDRIADHHQDVIQYDRHHEQSYKRSRREISNRISSVVQKKNRSSRKRDYASLIKYFFKDSCYFVIKSNNEQNVEIAKREGVWSTPMPNEIKLNSAFKEFRNVILIFSVKESGKFQGFARLSSEAQYGLRPIPWILPPGLHECPFGGVFFIDWVCRNELSFNRTSHLYNGFNDDKPVKIARDGQEIEPKVGEELCRLFPTDDENDLIPLLKRMKRQTSDRPKKHHARGPFMIDSDSFETNLHSNHHHLQFQQRIKSSMMPVPVSHSIKKRLDYHHDYLANRSREDRYRGSRRAEIYSSDVNESHYRYTESYDHNTILDRRYHLPQQQHQSSHNYSLSHSSSKSYSYPFSSTYRHGGIEDRIGGSTLETTNRRYRH